MGHNWAKSEHLITYNWPWSGPEQVLLLEQILSHKQTTSTPAFNQKPQN